MSTSSDSLRAVSVAILTGGNSSRFGRAKQLFEVDGQPLFSLCYEKFLRLSDDVFLQGEFSGARVEIRKDLVSQKGPLGGIYSALRNARHDRVFVLACDMPDLDSRILDLLLEHRESDLVVPTWRNGHYEPLCSLYSRGQIPLVEEMLAGGTLKISELFVRVERVSFPIIDEWIEQGLISGSCFRNMNELHAE
jgi:molybdopterin-guanine dinucleotide biosynthesis protein A